MGKLSTTRLCSVGGELLYLFVQLLRCEGLSQSQSLSKDSKYMSAPTPASVTDSRCRVGENQHDSTND